MGISELRQVGAPLATPGASESYAAQLVRSGAISASDMALVQLVQKHCDAPLERILLSEGPVSYTHLTLPTNREV